MREKFEGNHPGAAGPKIPGPDGGPMDSVRKPSFNHPADNRSRVEEALPEGGEAASSGALAGAAGAGERETSSNIFLGILKRATYASTGTIASRVATAITGILIARAVGPGPFGVYVSVFALVTVAVAFTETGLTYGLVREGARTPRLLPILLGNVLAVKSVLGILLLTGAYFLMPFFIPPSPDAGVMHVSELIFLPLAMASFANLCSDTVIAALHVEGKQKVVSYFNIARGLLFLAGTVAIMAARGGIEAFAWYQGILYLTSLIAMFFTLLSVVSISLDLSRIGRQVKDSFVFGISILLYIIYTETPILMLSRYSPEEDVGHFAVAFRFIYLALLAGTTAANQAFLPTLFGLFKAHSGKFRQVCSSMQSLFLPAGMVIGLGMYVSAESLIILLQGEQYRPAVEIMRTLCWIVVFSYGTLPVDVALTAGDRMFVKNLMQFFVTLIMVTVGFFMIKSNGVVGISYAMLLVNFCNFLFFVLYAYKNEMYGFTGSIRMLVPAALTITAGLAVIQILPQHNFISIFLFLLASLAIWSRALLRFAHYARSNASS